MATEDTEAERRRQALSRIEGRSPLHDWMRAHRADLEARFAAIRHPSWASVARALAELGVRDAKGQIPSPQTARQAWIKARAEAAASAPPAPPRPASHASGVTPGTARRAVPPDTPTTARRTVPSDAPATARGTASPNASGTARGAAPLPPARPGFDPMEGAFDAKPPPRFRPASLK